MIPDLPIIPGVPDKLTQAINTRLRMVSGEANAAATTVVKKSRGSGSVGGITPSSGNTGTGGTGTGSQVSPKSINAALVTGKPGAGDITDIQVSAAPAGDDPDFPYNAITPDGTQFFSIQQISFDDSGAAADGSALRIIITVQDLDANGNPVGPECYFDTCEVGGTMGSTTGQVDTMGPVMGLYGLQGATYIRSGPVAAVAIRPYVCNGVDQTPAAWQDATNSTLQTSVGGGLGYVVVQVAAGGQIPPAGIPAQRIATSSIGNGLSLTAAGLALKLASLGGLAFGPDGSTKANLGYTMRINASGQVELSNLPTSYGLPHLPDATYPAGSVVYDQADGKVYRTDGNTWNVSTSPADLVAGAVASGVTMAAAQISAGTLAVGVEYAGQINCSQVNAGAFNGQALYLTKSSTTVSVDAIYNAVMQGYYGLSVSGYSATYGTNGLYALPGALLIFNQDTGVPGSGGALIAQLARAISGGGGVVGGGYLMVGDMSVPQNQMVLTPAGLFRNSGSTTTQIAGPRQGGVGTPSGWSTVADSMTWCLRLYNALSGYGAIA